MKNSPTAFEVLKKYKVAEGETWAEAVVLRQPHFHQGPESPDAVDTELMHDRTLARRGAAARRWSSRRSRRLATPAAPRPDAGSAAHHRTDGHRHRAEGARGHPALPVSVTAVSKDTLTGEDITTHQRRGHLRAEHVLLGISGAQAELSAFPRHQLRSGQSGHHDLRRRRADDSHQRVEHRAARRRAGRVRARRRRARCSAATRSAASSTSPAAGRRSSKWTGSVRGAVRQLRRGRCARHRLWSAERHERRSAWPPAAAFATASPPTT